MKLSCTALVVLTVFCAIPALSQISFQWSDFPSNPGTLLSQENNGSDTVSVFQGASGPNCTWDFTSIQSSIPFDSDWMDPATTPFTTQFPQANRCLHFYDGSTASDGYQYYNLTTSNVTYVGQGFDLSPVPTIIYVTNPQPQVVFPVQYQIQWTSVYWFEPFTGVTSYDSTEYTVDAWGTVTDQLGTYQCLRVYGSKTTKTIIPPLPPIEHHFWSYQWYVPDVGVIVLMQSYMDDPNPNFTSGFFNRITGIQLGVSQEPARIILPVVMTLESIYPNPFNPSTTISYTVPQAMDVTLSILDLAGREISTLHQGRLTPGSYTSTFDGANLTSGIYFARLAGNGMINTQKLVLLK